jgi:hypothetical protein
MSAATRLMAQLIHSLSDEDRDKFIEYVWSYELTKSIGTEVLL